MQLYFTGLPETLLVFNNVLIYISEASIFSCGIEIAIDNCEFPLVSKILVSLLPVFAKTVSWLVKNIYGRYIFYIFTGHYQVWQKVCFRPLCIV